MDPKDFEVDPADDIDLDRDRVHTLGGQRMTNAAAEAMAADAEADVRDR